MPELKIVRLGHPAVFPYTLCFCISANQVLMLHRNNPPNKNLWNGIGGKIEANETHKQGVIREAKEETGIDIQKANTLRFTGVVTWDVTKEREKYSGGMYVYLVELTSELITWKRRKTTEGLLEWKDLTWVLDKNNKEVVENIPYFLPLMLKKNPPMEYHCIYKVNKLEKFLVNRLQ